MALSAEDSLRLNVLFTQELYAIRIDESKMTVFALTAKGEAKIPLNPIGKDDPYIREIKILFSTHVMGSLGGYPIFLKHWTRMGQARDESLAQMLLLGEPEAVVAVVHAPGLTDELAARAWWAMPTAENARRMLEKKAVAEGRTGKELADFLLEFLPFEADHKDLIESVSRVLQPGLITHQEKERLWKKAKMKRSFYVGFLHACADNLPLDIPSHPLHNRLKENLATLINAGNPYAILLEKLLSATGQAFLYTVDEALKKPGNQDVVVSLLDAVSAYFTTIRPECFCENNIDIICAQVDEICCSDRKEIQQLLQIDRVGEYAEKIKCYLRAMLVLSCLSVKLVDPIFAHSDAIGSVMRKKIKSVSDPIFEQLQILRD